MEIYQTISLANTEQELSNTLRELERQKVDGVRFNLCKYSDADIISAMDKLTRILSYKHNCLKVLLDIPYPYNKCRIKKIKSQKAIEIKRGDICDLCFSDEMLEKAQGTILLAHKPKINSYEGDVVYFGDGEGAFLIKRISDEMIRMQSLNDLVVWPGKAISIGLIDTTNVLSIITPRINTLSRVAKLTLAVSLVSSDTEIITLRKAIGESIGIMAKIETTSGVDKLESILQVSDGVMIARGDIALYNDYARLLEYEQHIVTVARQHQKSVYIATDVMRSLDSSYIPSRADIIDLSYIFQLNCTGIVLKSKRQLPCDYPHVLEVINHIGSCNV